MRCYWELRRKLTKVTGKAKARGSDSGSGPVVPDEKLHKRFGQYLRHLLAHGTVTCKKGPRTFTVKDPGSKLRSGGGSATLPADAGDDVTPGAGKDAPGGGRGEVPADRSGTTHASKRSAGGTGGVRAPKRRCVDRSSIATLRRPGVVRCSVPLWWHSLSHEHCQH